MTQPAIAHDNVTLVIDDQDDDGLLELPVPFRLPWRTLGALRDRPPVKEVVAGHLMEGNLVLPYGPSESAKSFVGVGLTCCVASGTPWHGHAVQQGAAFYVAAEGGAQIVKRFDAWCDYHKVDPASLANSLLILDRPVNLLDPEESTAFVFDIVSDRPTPRLVVLDTLAQLMTGGDENTGRDMSRVLAIANRIRTDTGACVLLIHHTGHDRSRERGHTSLRGAADTAMKITKDGDLVTLECDKQRDCERFAPLRFRLEPHLDSCILRTTTPSDDLTLSNADKDVLETLKAIALEDGVPTSIWEQSYGKNRSTFYRSRKRLIKMGLVRCEKRRYSPVTPTPTDNDDEGSDEVPF